MATSFPNSAGMSFVQLVARLRQECGVSGADPSTLQGVLAGEITRLANWVNTAWLDIQRARADWHFMRATVSFTATPAGGRTYTPTQVGIPQLATYKTDSFRAYPTAMGINGQQFLPWWDYDSFRNWYMFGPNTSLQARPVIFSVDPQKNIMLGPIPSEPYVISGEAFTQPVVLVSDSDYPTMPPQFHMLIVYKAMMMYGRYENAPEVYQDGETQYNRMLMDLTIDQSPPIEWGASLA